LDVHSLCEEKFQHVGKDDWLQLCDYVEKTKKKYCKRYCTTDHLTDQIIINLGEPNSDSESNRDEERGAGEFEKIEGDVSGMEKML
jgi:uncharacterized protein YfdQ (DUF2303 family)